MDPQASVAPPGQYLTFFVGGDEYGIEILRVREIVAFQSVTRVPQTPAWIAGVINLRGLVIPVVDLVAKFGLGPSTITSKTCIVMVEIQLRDQPTVMGILADAVSQVADLGPGAIEPVPAFGTRVRVEFLKGLGRLEEGFALLLDIDRVLAVDEFLAAKSVAEGAHSGQPEEARTSRA